MENQTLLLYNYLQKIGLSTNITKQLNALLLAIGLIIIVFAIDYITRKFLRQIFTVYASKSKTNFDDLLIENIE